MIDLKAIPYSLSDEEIRWVEQTISSMSLEEKLSQLFVLLKAFPGADEEQISTLLCSSRQGGMRWQGGDKQTVALQNRLFQKASKVPLFIAGNCDEGGNGVLPQEGSFVATAAEAGPAKGRRRPTIWVTWREWKPDPLESTGCLILWPMDIRTGAIPS